MADGANQPRGCVLIEFAICALPISAIWAAEKAGLVAQPSSQPLRMDAATTDMHKIRHIIMQKNHSFDEYFGTFLKADGIRGCASRSVLFATGARDPGASAAALITTVATRCI